MDGMTYKTNQTLVIEFTPDELDTVVESLMNLACGYAESDPEYTGEIVNLHNRLYLLTEIDMREAH